MRKGFTGIADVDLLILMELPDEDLFQMCFVNKYINEIYNRDSFWRNRILLKYGEKGYEKNPKLYYIGLLTKSGNIYKAYFDVVKVAARLARFEIHKVEYYYISKKQKDPRDTLLYPNVDLPPCATFTYYMYDDTFRNTLLGIYSNKKDFRKKYKKRSYECLVEMKYHL